MKFQVHTFGCKVNTYDTGLLQQKLQSKGFTLTQNQEAGSSRIHILNTCAVTAEATKEALRTIRRLKARDPFCLVVVTGCAAQVDTNQFEDLKAADLVVANSHKGELDQIIRKHYAGELKERVFKSNIFRKLDLEEGGGVESEHTRSFLKIQDGCNSFCTYCVIPFARGRSRSISVKNLVSRVNDLYRQGVREVVLTGVHIGDYEDGENRLEDLVEALLTKTSVPRFRLSSLEPVELSPRLIDLYKASDSKLCPHFHMSIQSANTKVLREMKRNYTASDVESSLQVIRKNLPHAFVGMDVITGFPGETDEEFEDTYQRLAVLPWTRIHVFPYSARPGTKASGFSNPVDRQIISERAKRLRTLSMERFFESARLQKNTLKRVLPLNFQGEGEFYALSRDYWSVRLTKPLISGQEHEVEITDWVIEGHQERSSYLIGRPVPSPAS